MKQRVCVRVGYGFRFRIQFYQITNLIQMDTYKNIIVIIIIKIRFLSPNIRIPRKLKLFADFQRIFQNTPDLWELLRRYAVTC